MFLLKMLHHDLAFNVYGLFKIDFKYFFEVSTK